MSSYRSPQKRFTSSYRRTPYSPEKKRANPAGSKFVPEDEDPEAKGPHPSLDVTLARKDPYHHYVLRTGKHRGKTMSGFAAEDASYLQWMKNKHYDNLSEDHILRKALDQWEAEPEPETPLSEDTGSFTNLAKAPPKFRRDGRKNQWVQGSHIKTLFHVTQQELIAAGARNYVSNEEKGTMKFALYHVYEYAKREGRVSEEEADKAVDTVLARNEQTKGYLNRCENGGGGFGCLCQFCD